MYQKKSFLKLSHKHAKTGENDALKMQITVKTLKSIKKPPNFEVHSRKRKFIRAFHKDCVRHFQTIT